MEAMNKNRIEAFSDVVLAIIITIMVLESPTPSFKRQLKETPMITRSSKRLSQKEIGRELFL